MSQKEKPSLTALLMPPEHNIQNPVEVANIHKHHSAQDFPNLEPIPTNQLTNHKVPTITKSEIQLHSAYQMDPLKTRKGQRIINYLQQIRTKFPSMWKILLIVIVAIVAPLILPALGVIPMLGVV